MKRPLSITGENGQERSLEGLLRGYSWRGLRLVAWNRYTQGRTRPGSLPCNVHQHGVRSGLREGRLEDIQTPAWWGPLAECWVAGGTAPSLCTAVLTERDFHVGVGSAAHVDDLLSKFCEMLVSHTGGPEDDVDHVRCPLCGERLRNNPVRS